MPSCGSKLNQTEADDGASPLVSLAAVSLDPAHQPRLLLLVLLPCTQGGARPSCLVALTSPNTTLCRFCELPPPQNLFRSLVTKASAASPWVVRWTL